VDVEPFGEYHGVKIGVKGRLPAPRTLEQVQQLCCAAGGRPPQVLPFGPESVQRVGIVSGGAADEAFQAIEEGLELFLTGEASHTVYHHCLEAGVNVIFGGHYQTEVWGVRALAEKLAGEEDLQTCFLDVPTGL
jgi:putative NIF3 family GTP cyclohydrolase 1 type 2